MWNRHTIFIKLLRSLIVPVFLGIVALQLLFIPVIYAQGEVKVREINPKIVSTDEETIVSITGINFARPISFELLLGNEPIPLEATLATSSLITVVVPAGLEVDNNYTLHFTIGNSPPIYKEFAVIFPTPTITPLEPAVLWNKPGLRLTISGENLNRFNSAYLGQAELTLSEFITPTSMTLVIPEGVTPGSKELALFFNSGVYTQLVEVFPYTKPEINSVMDRVIYNNKERQVIVSGSGLEATSAAFLGENGVIISEMTTNVLTLTVPQNFITGTYQLVLAFGHGDQLTDTETITITGPINPVLDSVQPQILVSGQSETILLSGTKLTEADYVWLYTTDASGARGSLITHLPISMVQGQEEPDDKIEVMVPADALNDNEDSANEMYLLKMDFPDDSTLDTPQISIYRSLFPLTLLGWFGLGFIFLIILGGSGPIYQGSLEKARSHFELFKTLPGSSIPWEFISRVLTVVFVTGIFVAIFWYYATNGLSSGQIRFLGVWLSVEAGLPLIWYFRDYIRQFSKNWAGVTQRLAIALSISLLVLPFALNRTDIILWAPYIVPGLVAVIIALGLWGVNQVEHELKDEFDRQVPPTAVILVQVHDTINRKGQVVIAEDFPKYPQDIMERVFATYVAEHSEQEFDYNKEAGTLAFRRSDEVRLFNQRFSALENLLPKPSPAVEPEQKAVADAFMAIIPSQTGFSPGKPFILTPEQKAAADAFMAIIASQMGFSSGKPFTLKQEQAEFLVYSFNSAGLESVLPTPFPFILFLSRLGISSTQIEELKQLLNQISNPRRFALLLIMGAAQASKAKIQAELGKESARENIVVLDNQDWRTILTSKQERPRAFMNKVNKQLIDLTILSPYQLKGPTKTDMCFGRDLQIDRIAEIIKESSVAILGARRIGKTSMLNKIGQILEARNYLLLYLDCYSVNDYETFFRGIAAEDDWRKPLSGLNLERYRDKEDFSEFVFDIKNKFPDKNIVFQFDEIDRLLSFDAHPSRDELLFRRFRSLAQKRHCQFIFSGERMILEKLFDPTSSFFNFATPFQVELLNRKNANELIAAPMELLGVTLKQSETILDLIFEATEGHPNLIQLICQTVLGKIDPTQDRLITPAMLDEVIRSPEFSSEYIRIFESQTTFLEKAMALLACMVGAQDEYSIRKQLRQFGFEVSQAQITQGLEYLKLCHLFAVEGDNYHIKSNRYMEYKKAAIVNIEDLMEDYLAKWEATPNESRDNKVNVEE